MEFLEIGFLQIPFKRNVLFQRIEMVEIAYMKSPGVCTGSFFSPFQLARKEITLRFMG